MWRSPTRSSPPEACMSTLKIEDACSQGSAGSCTACSPAAWHAPPTSSRPLTRSLSRAQKGVKPRDLPHKLTMSTFPAPGMSSTWATTLATDSGRPLVPTRSSAICGRGGAVSILKRGPRVSASKLSMPARRLAPGAGSRAAPRLQLCRTWNPAGNGSARSGSAKGRLRPLLVSVACMSYGS